ncbi:AraC family transcriptional regulator [Streptomyces sp. BE147]|uniref:helix-turn-helix domain-containing protein n=1 Tax=Streptomyces sp. BE147 TaxID=3002524 RepID=UPI002E78462F|nr:AraC family transcriptional regulator [Streptomyces sp. BE147]MEE1741239.1 AraC family transcriptional regulator [Streptomyces sp. BE147]
MLATVPGRERGEAPPAVAPRWAEPSPGGALVSAPYLLTTAVFDGSTHSAAATGGVHTHTDALLVWPHHGSLTLHTRHTMRRLVPGQGVWLPPGTPHDSSPDPGSVSCYTYVTRAAIPPHWSAARPLRVRRALQEMLLHLDATPMPDDLRLRTQRVVIDLLEEDPHPAIDVPVPEDARIRALADDVMRDPESDLSLEAWAARHALSVRTVTRAFGRDVGMSFARWRSLVRMSAATTLLAQGRPVNLVAHRCGYSTTSAFSAAFRRVTGASPTEYLRDQTVPAPAGH